MFNWFKRLLKGPTDPHADGSVPVGLTKLQGEWVTDMKLHHITREQAQWIAASDCPMTDRTRIEFERRFGKIDAT